MNPHPIPLIYFHLPSTIENFKPLIVVALTALSLFSPEPETTSECDLTSSLGSVYLFPVSQLHCVHVYQALSRMNPSSTLGTTPDSDVVALDGRRDSEFRKFGLAVERTLQSFDSVSEWADVIGFLTRLGKIFHLYKQFTIVPKKLVVSKRLAQCLNPALPTGAHAKALEVYALIFQAAGRMQLSEDLLIWSYGIFPFSAHAAVSVKPLLLGLYERFYIPLGTNLRPALKGLILGLLPMLEEEDNEFFDRAVSVLDKISHVVEHSSFFHALWLAIISSTCHRLSAVHYLLRRFAKMNTTEDMVVIIGSSAASGRADLLAPALACLLNDKAPLVQRGALELLVTQFPIGTNFLTAEDVQKVISAAIGVVLRRDMSLNRRLYSWILGSIESPLRYVSENIASVTQSLRIMFYADDLLLPIAELSRPYKITISLLDKPELGPLIMDTLFLDILRSLKIKCEKSKNMLIELLPVATMLLDTLDAFFIWKQLHELVSKKEDYAMEFQALELVMFVLENFKFSDDESQRVHLPFLYQTVSSSLRGLSSENLSDSELKLDVRLSVCVQISRILSDNVFLNSWKLAEFRGSSIERRKEPGMEGSSGDRSVYGDPSNSISQQQLESPGAVSSFLDGDLSVRNIGQIYRYADSNNGSMHDLLQDATVGKPSVDASLAVIRDFTLSFILALSPAENVQTGTNDMDHQYLLRIWDNLSRIFMRHADAGSSFGDFGITWINALVSFSTQDTSDFHILHPGLCSLFAIITLPRSPSHQASQQQFLSPSNITLICCKLWKLLLTDQLAYHRDCIVLILKLMDLVGVSVLEDCITKMILQGDVNSRIEGFYRFGVLWRCLESMGLDTCLLFSRPLLLIFDAFKSHNLQLKLAAQNWIRSFVKSYSRIIPLLLAILTHADIHFDTCNTLVGTEYVEMTCFVGLFNHAQVGHAFEILCLLLELDDPSLLKSLSSSDPPQPWIKSACTWAEGSHDFVSSGISLVDAIVVISLRFISANSVGLEASNDATLRERLSIQQNACYLLKRIISSIDILPSAISLLIHDTVVSKLHICLLQKSLDLQSSLLKILGLVTTRVYQSYPFHRIHKLDNNSDGSLPRQQPLLVKTMLGAIASLSNRPMLQHWLDFVILYLPRFRPYFAGIIRPLFVAICSELRENQTYLADLLQPCQKPDPLTQNAIGMNSGGKPNTSTHTRNIHMVRKQSHLPIHPEQDLPALLHSIECILIICFHDENSTAANSSVRNSAGGDAKGSLLNISSIIGNVLTGDSSVSDALSGYDVLHGQSDKAVQEQMLEMVPDLFSILAIFCSMLDRLDLQKFLVSGTRGAGTSHMDDVIGIADRIKSAVRLVTEAVYKPFPLHAIEAIVEVWLKRTHQLSNPDISSNNASLYLLDLISECSPRAVVGIVSDSIRFQLPYLHGSSSMGANRDRLKPSKPIPDTCMVAFLEFYIRNRVSFTVLMECWPTLISYLKEACVQAAAVKYIFPQLLRLVHSILEKFHGTVAFDNKRLRREAEETLQRISDYCILIIGRAFDQGSWRRVITGDTVDSLFRDEKFDSSAMKESESLDSSNHSRNQTKSSEDMLIQETMIFFADTLFPSLRKFILDNDRITALSSNFTYYVVGPMLKSRHSMNKLFLNPALDCICALSQIPASLKVCRKEIWEAFLDSRFFQMGTLGSKKWQKIMHSTISSDKERLTELLARISATSSTTLFVSRDQEIINRAQMLRRLSFILHAAPIDFYLPQLPGIQEKIVEVFKSPSDVLQLEGFFCLRILFCRISEKHMANFWPMILSELIRVFSIYIRDSTTDKSEDLALLLAACKLVDLLITLGIEEFQWHQWLFVTETCSMPSISDNKLQTSASFGSNAPPPVGLLGKLGHKWTTAAALMDDLSISRNSSDVFGDSENLLDRDLSQMSGGHRKLRRPLITLRTIQHRSGLDWFVQHASYIVYNNTLVDRQPDLDYLDVLFEQEFPDIDLTIRPGPLHAVGSSSSIGSGSFIAGTGKGSPLLSNSSCGAPLKRTSSKDVVVIEPGTASLSPRRSVISHQ
ncbi:hypothetical protein BASA83_005784 [Batrachochytrium salamandrivorans]|nr:hypothetical protein BASA62_009366 [Batrachochytrium salamandrivorans]KAH9271946.1 hypothetical protein BASA83_005784 [Batrachochytrium salamandrivorans]